MDLAIVRAQGVFAAYVATLLQRAGVTTVDEFGKTLGILAAGSAPSETDEAEILFFWAAMVLDTNVDEPEDTGSNSA